METIVTSWKSINWEDLQGRLDGEINAIGIRQDHADEGKKRLLEESTKYRENTTKETRKCAVPLIKAFQKEVDDLRGREKANESALIEICTQFVNLPDPTPVLAHCSSIEAAAARCLDAEEQVALLKQRNQHLTDELSGLKNQDVTIRQLRDRIVELEVEKERESTASAERAEKETKESYERTISEMNEQHERVKGENGLLEKKVSELEARMRDAQRRLDNAKSSADQKQSIEAEQVEMVERELAEANRKLTLAEVEISRLNAELVEARSTARRGSALEDIAALGSLMKEKDDHISRLLEENRRLTEQIATDAKKTGERVHNMQREIEAQKELINRMQLELSQRGDYDAVKQELRTMRELEFGPEAMEIEEKQETVGEALKRIDRMLAEKNRRLQSENSILRTTNEDLRVSLSKSEEEGKRVKEEHEEARRMVARLEDDLARITKGRNTAAADDDMSTVELLASSLKVQQTEPESDQSVLSIMTSQRDRLREKVQQLEEERAAEKNRQAVLQSEIDKVREDNVRLYGKIKFLQSYRARGSPAVDVEGESSYSGEYERRLDPFSRFTFNEKERSMQKLPIHDKATLSIGRAIMSSAMARLTFFFYLLLLHLLVFLVLYRSAFSAAADRDFQQDCVEKFAQHMKSHSPGG